MEAGIYTPRSEVDMYDGVNNNLQLLFGKQGEKTQQTANMFLAYWWVDQTYMLTRICKV